MELWSEPSVLFEQSTMFTKSRFCKLYKATTEKPSGYVLHSHDYMQIWYVTKGCCEHLVEGQIHMMARDDIFILPPRIEHQTKLFADSEIICCEFAFDHFFPDRGSIHNQVHDTVMTLSFVWLFLQDTGDVQSQFSLAPNTAKRVHDLMYSMLREYDAGEMFFEEFLRVQIMELLLLLAREHSQLPQGDTVTAVYDKYKPMVEDAIAYIDQNFALPLKLEDVCRVSMVSKTYFCYIFKLLTQQTFVEYIMNTRIQEAIRLLKQPDNSITWVGFEVGFNDSTHFSRTFKKITGISPRTFRAIKNSEK